MADPAESMAAIMLGNKIHDLGFGVVFCHFPAELWSRRAHQEAGVAY